MKLSILAALLPAPALSKQTLKEVKGLYKVAGARSFDDPKVGKVTDITADNVESTQIILEQGAKRNSISVRQFVQLRVVTGTGAQVVEKEMLAHMDENTDGDGEADFPTEVNITDVVVLQAKDTKGNLKDVYPANSYKHFVDKLALAEAKYKALDVKDQDETSAYRIVYQDNAGLAAHLLTLAAPKNTEAIKTFKVSI